MKFILSLPPLSASIETFCEYGYLLVTVYPSITHASPPSSFTTKYGSLSYLMFGNIFLALSIICLFNKKYVSLQKRMNQQLIDEIKKYCLFNNIEDVDGQIDACLRKGFDILKYGLSPIDNYKREKQDTKQPVDKTTNTIEEKQENGVKEETPQKVRRKIRIIKK